MTTGGEPAVESSRPRPLDAGSQRGRREGGGPVRESCTRSGRTSRPTKGYRGARRPPGATRSCRDRADHPPRAPLHARHSSLHRHGGCETPTDPSPCQCRPTRSNRPGGLAALSEALTSKRNVDDRHRRPRLLRTDRGPGGAGNNEDGEGSEERFHGGSRKRGCDRLRRQAVASLLDGILTSGKRPGEDPPIARFRPIATVTSLWTRASRGVWFSWPSRPPLSFSRRPAERPSRGYWSPSSTRTSTP